MSQTVTKDVKSGGKVVGQVELEVFDDLDESVDSLGEGTCVAFINKQNAIDQMDAVRREATGSTSSGMRDLMKRIKENPERFEQLKAEFDISAGGGDTPTAEESAEAVE